MKMLRALRVFAPAVLALAVVAACSSSDGGQPQGADGIVFHGEATLLEGFKFDTGPQPATGPASVSLRLTASGKDVIEARADVADGKLSPKAGTGTLTLDAKFVLDGTLKINTTVKKYEGDLPGLKDISIPITGSTTFDPFLFEGGAQVDADIPETKLPDVPLGGVPGHLSLTVVAGSKLTTKFSGTCMTVAGGSAQYEGTATTGGTLVIKGTIVVDLPKPANFEVPLPAITIPIPSLVSKVAFAPVTVNGAADEVLGSCKPLPGDGGVVDSDFDAPGEDTATDTAGPLADTAKPPTDTAVPPTDTAVRDTAVDTAVDTTIDTGPICAGDVRGGMDSEATAYSLGTITDCDGTGGTQTGVSAGSTDFDIYKYEGTDTAGCSAYPQAKVTGAATVCIKPVCKAGTTNVTSCLTGTLSGGQCCGGAEAEAVFNCAGTTSESATIYMTVKPNASVADSCSSYSLAYHF
jgi:hypothetical protein